MNFKRKLLLLLISFSIILPINVWAYSKYLIPGGENIGIKVNADGAYVVGFYKVNGHEIAKEAGLEIGDRIISINDQKIDSVNDLLNHISSNKNILNVKMVFVRNDKINSTNLSLKKDQDGTYKTGIYVKDSITGIGTITYIDPTNNSYGALGHEIIDTNTGVNFKIKKGNIFASSIVSITKASFNKPGEKNAKLKTSQVLGNIEKNIETGIYGKLEKRISDSKILPVAEISEVKIGNAEIITVLEGNKKETFKIEILSIDQNNPTKNFLFKVIDQKLLDKTGGVVKGMSGSPIIQDGKIIGAVTHTILDNPQKGYGISIIKMLESIE